MLLFCSKTIVKESHKLELASLKKKPSFWPLATFLLGAFMMFLAPVGVLFVMKTLEDEQ